MDESGNVHTKTLGTPRFAGTIVVSSRLRTVAGNGSVVSLPSQAGLRAIQLGDVHAGG